MGAPLYTHDLILLADCDATGTWIEPAVPYAVGGSPSADNEYFIHRISATPGDNGAVTQAFSASKTGLMGMIFDFGGSFTVPTDGAILLWQFAAAPSSMTNIATGGMRCLVGNLSTAFYAHYVGGLDHTPYPYGGWINHAFDPAQTADDTVGVPSGTWQWVGCAINCNNAVTKGNPHGVDVVRYGRCESRIASGSLADGYATFAGFAALNDAVDARWGLIQDQGGSFLVKGRVVFGAWGGVEAPVEFVDSDSTIFIQDVKKVSSTFNQFEILHPSSTVDLTRCSITSLSDTSPGSWKTASGSVTKDACVFTGMSTFEYGSADTISGTTYSRCSTVYPNGATFSECNFTASTASVAVLVSTPSDANSISGGTFLSSGTGYGIQMDGSVEDVTLNGVTFTNYAGTDGSAGNEAIFVNITTGTMSINIAQSGTIPSINTAGAFVDVVAANVHTVTDLYAGSRVVWIRQSDEAELENKQEVSGSAFYSYPATGSLPIYLSILSQDKKNKTVSITLGNTDQSFPASQEDDPFFFNP